MNKEIFWLCVFAYFLLGLFTFGLMTIDAKLDSKGCFTKESCYKMFWGSTFWPVTWIITFTVFFYELCIELVKFPRFIADAFIWGIKSLKPKKVAKRKEKVFHDKNFNHELCRLMYEWEDSGEPAQDVAMKYEEEILQAAFKIFSNKIKMSNKYPEGITEVNVDELIWNECKPITEDKNETN